MPFVNAKITLPIDDSEKEIIQSKLTDFVAVSLSKPREFIIVNIEDSQQIWFAGFKLERGAFISVRLMGNAEKSAYNELTKKLRLSFKQFEYSSRFNLSDISSCRKLEPGRKNFLAKKVVLRLNLSRDTFSFVLLKL